MLVGSMPRGLVNGFREILSRLRENRSPKQNKHGGGRLKFSFFSERNRDLWPYNGRNMDANTSEL